MKNTKTKLISSVTMLLICFAMLIGSTFAWFTDSASTGVNKIQAGSLDVEILKSDGTSASGGLGWLKNDETVAGVGEILWEPGARYKIEPFKIINKGDLALKFKLNISVAQETVNPDNGKKLSDVISWQIKESDNYVPFDCDKVYELNTTNAEQAFDIRAVMSETAGNDYMGLTIESVIIDVVATQKTYESDSFGNDYDLNANYPVVTRIPVVLDSENKTISETTVSTSEKITDDNGDEVPLATFIIPSGVILASETRQLEANIEPASLPSGITIDTGTTSAQTYNVSVIGLDGNNTEKIGVQIFVGSGLTQVKVYHEENPMDSADYTYDTRTGYVTFKTASFSPFTVTYSKNKFVVMTADELKAVLTECTDAGSGNNTVTIAKDIALDENSTWIPVTVDGYNGAGVITIEGNNHVISGLNDSLFAGGFAGSSGIVIKDLTLKNVSINDDTETQGIGAFIKNIDSMPKIELINCHLLDSTIISTGGARVGGLIGWSAGYNKANDGPVDTYITIDKCSVENTRITAAGSVGAIIGHAGSNPATYHTITNCTVTDTKLHSTDNGEWRVGVVVGTANVGKVEISRTKESGNTLTQVGKTAPSHSNLYGRFSPKNGDKGNTGILIINGDSISQE